MVCASSRLAASDSSSAPEPTLTSSTSAPMPSANFLLITELAISGSDSTVAVMSRSAYSFLSAGASCPGGEDRRTDVAQLLAHSLLGTARR